MMSLTVGEKSELNQESFEQRARELEQEKKIQENEIAKDKENAKKSPFDRFYQINETNSKYLTKLATEQPKALAILLFIFENMDGYNALTVSYKVLQEKFNISRATTARCIKYLKEHGFLHVYKAGSCNVYVANNDLVWKSWGKNVKYCKFPSNVILSASEQEQKDEFEKQKFTTITVK